MISFHTNSTADATGQQPPVYHSRGRTMRAVRETRRMKKPLRADPNEVLSPGWKQKQGDSFNLSTVNITSLSSSQSVFMMFFREHAVKQWPKAFAVGGRERLENGKRANRRDS